MPRKRAGTELREFLDSVPAGVVIVEIASRKVVFANTHMLSVLRMDLQQLSGRKCYEVLCPNLPNDCPILDRNLDITQSRCVIQTGNGRHIPVQKTVTRVEFEGAPCLLEAFRDITEELKLEDLKEDLERITRHDLKTPLIQIINLADLLLLDDALRPEHRTYAAMIQKAGRRTVRIINASLDLYKMESGIYCLFPVAIRLVGVVKDIVTDLVPQVRDQGISFDLHFDEGVSVWGEDALVYCALSNLIKNAAEATLPGGKVDIAVRKDQVATVAIHNQLPVPAAIRERFFEKYATHGKQHGTGLGTYSALLSVKAMHGDLGFASSEEAGTTVTVALPLAPDEVDYEEPALAD
jgi:signal transduction histidine kinase